MTSPYDSALTLAMHQKWAVFPIDHPEGGACTGLHRHEPDALTCTERGKVPAVKFTEKATTDIQTIAAWWAGMSYNVGIYMAGSGLLVIDEDTPDGFAKYAADHGVEIPPTYTVKTANGRHYYFRDTENGALSNTEGALREYGIDVRSGNAYVVGPGSVHKSGVVYTVENPAAVAILPPWVVDAIKAKTNGHKAGSGSYERFQLPDIIKDHHRDDTLFSYASHLLALDYPRDEAEALMERAWKRCEQPPQAKDFFPFEKALEKLNRYEPGRSEGYQKTNGSEPPPEGDFTGDVYREVYKTKVRNRAREVIAEEDAQKVVYPEFMRLDDFLAKEIEAPKQLIEGVWNHDTPVLMAAQYKAGKTTMRDNAVKSLVDGYDFLGKFKVNQLTEGTIVILDLELSEVMLQEWLRDQKIKNPERVVVVPMRGRGHALNLMLPRIRQYWATKLMEWNCKVLILDCLRPVLDALGLNEDKEAGRFLNGGFDPLRAEADIPNGMVIHHMGHTGDRARGDSSMLGWGDTWKISREEVDEAGSARYFSAYGRDIDVLQGKLEMDASRHLRLVKGTRKEAEQAKDWALIRGWVKKNQPVSGVSAVVRAFRTGNDQDNESLTDRRIRSAVKWAQRNNECTGDETPGRGEIQELSVISLGFEPEGGFDENDAV